MVEQTKIIFYETPRRRSVARHAGHAGGIRKALVYLIVWRSLRWRCMRLWLWCSLQSLLRERWEGMWNVKCKMFWIIYQQERERKQRWRITHLIVLSLPIWCSRTPCEMLVSDKRCLSCFRIIYCFFPSETNIYAAMFARFFVHPISTHAVSAKVFSSQELTCFSSLPIQNAQL